MSGKVDWYKDDVMLVVAGASDEFLTKIALQTEGEAKPRAPVDTGFMRNAIYALGPGANGRAEAVAAAQAVADRDVAPALHLEEHEAAVHAAAEYSVYQEMRTGFLYGALEAVAAQVGGLIEKIGKRWFG